MREKYSGVDVLYQDDVFTTDGAAAGAWEKLDDYVPKSVVNDFTDLTRHFIELHGGTVGYEPTSEGNNFYFILPAPPVDAPQSA